MESSRSWAGANILDGVAGFFTYIRSTCGQMTDREKLAGCAEFSGRCKFSGGGESWWLADKLSFAACEEIAEEWGLDE